MMRICYSILFFFALHVLVAQNSLNLWSGDSTSFRVFVKGKASNELPQSQVLVERVKEDTFFVELEFAGQKKIPATFLLLEKGEPCVNKEFNYRIDYNGARLKSYFMGTHTIIPLPQPLVPAKPDTNIKQKQVARVQEKKAPADPKPVTKTACQGPASYFLIDAYAGKLAALNNDSERLEVLRKTYADLCYSPDQVARLLSKFVHDRDKLEAAKLLYFNCVEKDRSLKATSDVFTYDLSIKELTEFVDRQGRTH